MPTKRSFPDTPFERFKRSCYEQYASTASAKEDPEPFSLDAAPEHYYHLGGNKFACVSNYYGAVRVHLRQFKPINDGRLVPTKQGVTLTPFLWECVDFDCINLPSRTGEIAIVRDSILFASVFINDTAYISVQRYQVLADFSRKFLPGFCKFTENEWDSLKRQQEAISKSVLAVTYGRVFPVRVFTELEAYGLRNVEDMPSVEGEKILNTSLVEILSSHVSESIEAIFDCNGCNEQQNNQLGHECITYNHSRRFASYGHMAIARIDLSQLAEDFVNKNIHISNFITKTFFDNLNIELLFKSVEDHYVSTDPDPLRMY